MTLSPGQKVQPKPSMRTSPGGFSAFCSSILSERAPSARGSSDRAPEYRVSGRARKFRDPVPHDRQELPHPVFRVLRIEEVEVSAFSRGEIRHQALVDPVRIDVDPALGSLPEDL